MTGTVAAFALQVLLYFGCNPIIFIGQDSAIFDTTSHCKGGLTEEVAARKINKFNTAEVIYFNQIKKEKIKINKKNAVLTELFIL